MPKEPEPEAEPSSELVSELGSKHSGDINKSDLQELERLLSEESPDIAQNISIDNTEQFLSNLCLANPDATFISNHEDKILYTNEHVQTELGYSEEDIKNHKFAQLLFPADYREIYLEDFEQHAHHAVTLPPLQAKITMWLMDIYGATKQYNSSRYSLIVNDTPFYITNLIPVEEVFQEQESDDEVFGELVKELETENEVTAQKAEISILNETLDLAQAAVKAKDQFLANMSHEIRSPMNIVLGMSRLLSKTELTPKQQNYIEKVESASVSLLGIINDILDFSKIEAHKIELEQQPFHLDELLKNLRNMVEFKANEKDLVFNLKIAEDVPKFLIGDPLRLTQILNNLAFNAIKFTSEGSIDIKIELQSFARSTDEEDVTLLFSVIDTGIGLTQAEQDRLFQAFQQADNSITRQFGGTGLGLAISKELTELMGGEIGITSEKGEGSTFFFTTKLKIQAQSVIDELNSVANETEELEQKLEKIVGANVLLVDDILGNQELASELLSDIGLNVSIASNGQEAVNAVKNASPQFDLVLMDLQMPIMDGYEATRQISEELGITELPIIAMTANAMVSDRQKTLAAGMVDHVAKPIDIDELYGCLAKWIKPRTTEELEANDKGSEVMFLLDEYIENEVAEEPVLIQELHQQELAEKKSKANTISTHIKPVLMIIDQDKQFTKQLESNLADKYHLVYSDKAENAIDMAIESNPCIIAVERHLPTQSGLELCAKIKHHEKLNHIPIIILSNDIDDSNEAEELMNMMEAGAEDILNKASDIHAIALRIEQFISVKQIKEQTTDKLHDQLTGLPNHSYFHQQLQSLWKQGIRSQAPISLVYIRINAQKEKTSIEEMEHNLIEVSKVINDLLSRPSDFFCRYDSEIFACILPETHEQGAKWLANSFWETINALEIPLSNILFDNYLSISVGGCCTVPSMDTQPDQVVFESLRALAEAELMEDKQVNLSYLEFFGHEVHHIPVDTSKPIDLPLAKVDRTQAFTEGASVDETVIDEKPLIDKESVTKQQTTTKKKTTTKKQETASENSKPTENTKQAVNNSLAGIDKEAALKRVRGKEKLLNSLLKGFVRDFSDAHQVIKTALDDKDFELSARTAHSVKGMSGNISAQELFDASLALEMGIKQEQNEQWPELLENFNQQLSLVLNSINSYLDEAAPQAKTESTKTNSGQAEKLNIETIKPVVTQLQQQLSEMSMDADETLEKLNQLMSGSHQAEVDGIAEAMDQLDYDKATELLTTFAEQNKLG